MDGPNAASWSTGNEDLLPEGGGVLYRGVFVGTGSRAAVETSPGTPSGEDSGGFPGGDQAEFPEPRENFQEVSRATW